MERFKAKLGKKHKVNAGSQNLQTRIIGGQGGIRTHEPLARLPDFESGPL